MMILAPRLLQYRPETALSDRLFSDLQLDRILSAQAIDVLRHPCVADGLAHRNELFLLLGQNDVRTRVEKLLSTLCDNERALYLLREARLPLDTYYRQADVLDAYLASCRALASMHDVGSLFSEVAKAYSSEAVQRRLSDMEASVAKIRRLLHEMQTGLLSFGDRNWLTPDYDAVSEIEDIFACAARLGFDVLQRRRQDIGINSSLSDAMCRLYAEQVAQIEDEIAGYADVDLYTPTAYIPEIRFFLEIHALTQRAAEIGVLHCIARISQAPKYTAKDLYDVSLLAKDCERIVPNDADFTEQDPFCFLVGANGGGKTTYLRALGVNLLLFLAGCPVFAKQAEIFPFDTVLAHFPKDERFDDSGRLDDERARTEEMLRAADAKVAFLLFNETFSGTDDKRGFDLLTDTAARIGEGRHFGLYVTHFHEVMSLDLPVLSAEVDPLDANKRTYRIVRSKGSASSYAADILKKYRLDRDSLAQRRCGHGN